MTVTNKPTERLQLRLTTEAKRKLRTAAALNHRSLSNFVIESALLRAGEVLPDRKCFWLDDKQWEAFRAALDKPARPLPQMRKLLSSSGPF